MGTVKLSSPDYAGNEFLSLNCQIFLIVINPQTVIAHSAGIFAVCFPKIAHQRFASALICFEKVDQGFKMIVRNLFLLPLFLIDKILNFMFIPVTVQEQAVGS